MANRFEDLEVWKKAYKLSISVYTLLSNCKDFGFKDQITRSSLSIPSNIAEGFERKSNREFIQYLYVAKGSAGELRTQLYIALEVGYIDAGLGNELIKTAEEVSYMLKGLIQKRKHF